MNKNFINYLVENIKKIGIVCLIISIVTWTLDIFVMVPPCSYCRVQRTIIGILGLVMLLSNNRSGVKLYATFVLGFFAAHVAATQHFKGWEQISNGQFKFNELIYLDSFLLSGVALLILIGQVILIYLSNESKK